MVVSSSVEAGLTSASASVERMKAKVCDKLGVNEDDAVEALLMWNGMLWGEWIAILVGCMRYQPIRTLARTPIGVRMRERLSSAIKTTFNSPAPASVDTSAKLRKPMRTLTNMEESVLSKAENMAQSRWLRPIPNLLHQASLISRKQQTARNFTLSVAETIVLYNTFFPLLGHLALEATVFSLTKRNGNKKQ